jgi:hypothetical protein
MGAHVSETTGESIKLRYLVLNYSTLVPAKTIDLGPAGPLLPTEAIPHVLRRTTVGQ